MRLARGGILAVTATDLAPLAGTYPDACKRKYWAKPLRNHLMHEIGLRILIRKIQLIGTQHDKALIPIYSYYKDHYFRVFFKCIKGKKECDRILSQHEYLLYTDMQVETSKHLPKDAEYAGPLWTGGLWDKNFAKTLCGNDKFLGTIYLESQVDTVGFYDMHKLSGKLKKDTPRFEKIIEAIRNKGFSASRTHFSEKGIKTDMTLEELKKLVSTL